MYDTMNKGIILIDGDIIGILNSSDYIYADKGIIKKIITVFEEKKVNYTYGNLDFFGVTFLRNWGAGSARIYTINIK